MQLTIESHESFLQKAVIKASGEIDIATVDHLMKAIDQQEKKLIIIDLSGVTFIDSTGIGLILRKVMEMREKGTEIHLDSIPELIDKVLDEMGIYEILNEFEGR